MNLKPTDGNSVETYPGYVYDVGRYPLSVPLPILGAYVPPVFLYVWWGLLGSLNENGTEKAAYADIRLPGNLSRFVR